MPVLIVVGAQWGDEGKGKIVDLLAEEADLVVRSTGGDNAGHTVVNRFGTFKLHLTPSGIFSPRATAVIGNGVVINPSVLIEELDQLKERGVDTSGLFISDRTNLVMPYHVLLDGLEEKLKGGNAIGTTGKGIGPAYTDKTTRLGIRTGDLLDKETLRERLHFVLEYKNTLLTKVYGVEPLSEDEIYKQYCAYGERLAPHIRETTIIIEEVLNNNKTVLVEGAQGALLDTDFGTYPFATSSSPLVSGSCLGAGIGPTNVTQSLGIFKAYCTRVGSGPLPTELHDEIGERIRDIAHEYGTTTGRPRRCGWFDGVAARFSRRINGFTRVAITRLDVLDSLPSLKICTHYEVDGQKIDNFPASIPILEKCKPVYEEFPGWMTSTEEARRYEDLPLKARQYVERLEKIIGSPVSIISIGMRREQTIFKIPVL